MADTPLNEAKPKSRRGGARPGAGRKRNVEKFGDLRKITDAELRTIVKEHVPHALKDLVKGVYVEERNRDGSTRVYQQPPNVRAIEAVLERVFGKVTDKVEHSGTLSLEAIDAIRAASGR